MQTESPRVSDVWPAGGEFLFLVAFIMACQVIAVDAMLPALPAITRELGLTDTNLGQWIVMIYMAGLGVGQLFWGLLSDRFGRRKILLIGLAIFTLAALLAGFATDFASLLAWRFIHGMAASSLVVSRSVVRDLYDGPQMAKVMSMTFIVFIFVPIIAPSLGQGILLIAPWRYLLALFALFGMAAWLWIFWRLPETLHPEYRMTLTVAHVVQSTWQVLTNRQSIFYTLAMTAVFGAVLGYIGMVQQIFDTVFTRPTLMPSIFAVCATGMGVMSFVNAKMVERHGMPLISQIGLFAFIGIAAVHTLVAYWGLDSLLLFTVLQTTTMGCLGLMIANFGTMAMQPMGPIAGIAASLQGFISSVGGALIGAAIGNKFHGSILPLPLGTLICGVLALVFILLAEQGRLFQASPAGGMAVPGAH